MTLVPGRASSRCCGRRSATRDERDGRLGVGEIARTTEASWLKVPHGFLPDTLVALRGPLNWLLPGGFTDKGDLQLGPIPKGTPVGFVGHLDPLPQEAGVLADIGANVAGGEHGLAAAARPGCDAQGPRCATRSSRPWGANSTTSASVPTTSSTADTISAPIASDRSRGLTDADKRALIEFLKTF